MRETSEADAEVVGRAEEDFPDSTLEIFPDDLEGPLRMQEIFGNRLPIEVDLGSGSGKFLIEAAKSFPEKNFVGVERLLGRVRKTRRKALHAGLWNLRILRAEIDLAVSYLEASSIDRFHLNFPDPWPKRRHHPRRVVDAEFLESVWKGLTDEGELWIKTDHLEYFERILKVSLEMQSRFEQRAWSDSGYGTTDFEELFLSKGLPIYRLRLLKRK